MVVRFPSADEGHDPTPAGDDRLAPVTPLRRAAVSRGAAGSASPRSAASPQSVSPQSVSAPSAAGEADDPEEPVTTRPVVELPGATRWNNTWGDAESSAGRRRAADSGSGARAVGGADADESDEESERQSQKVTAVTIRQLARRGMSRWELEQVLLKREIEPEVFGPELDRLEAMGVIDDASLAVSLAFTQHSRKGLGRSAIEQELKRRHIDPVLIEAALADIADEDELDRATELAVKRIGQLSSYDDETARRRLHGFLARKGYGSSVVRQAMDAAFATRRRGGVRFQ
ncbi:regulatory protein RecX [Leifsonia sp. F6_8S_P_1B]|uniref:Regulatory protein RecX n=1 Tax=Leifsonia williamsii TaxID=3035919 RepID=A0ABT8KHA1_9MICO|nr:regulatory protein RecX [Leifsonia williamsii]MDN4615704.1 regulatory protein RecX [Leifsonia williamsii]